MTEAAAPWRTRAAALAVDLLPGGAVLAASALVALAVPRFGLWWWVLTLVAAAAVLLTAVNRVLLPAVSGRSVGRAAFGIAVVSAADGAAPSAVRLLARDAAHLLDTAAVGVGWLWPLRDARSRTFADLLTGTEVRVDPTGAQRRPAAVTAGLLAAAATLVCVGAATIATFAVYRPDRAIDTARAQLYDRGPGIVEQLLSYDPQTLDADFARAQSLATPHYREQLVPQQEAVQRGKPVPNLYRAVNAAVLSAEPHRAAMLVFLQGQRGNDGAERLITATVRVTFVQKSDAWLVDDLAVVTKPEPVDETSEGGR